MLKIHTSFTVQIVKFSFKIQGNKTSMIMFNWSILFWMICENDTPITQQVTDEIVIHEFRISHLMHLGSLILFSTFSEPLCGL